MVQGSGSYRLSNALEDFAVRARTAPRTSRIDVETAAILDACAAVGVEPLVLKGVALVRTLYRSDETRGYFDIDLLVAPDDLPAVERVLEHRGYRNSAELLGVDDIGGYLHADTWSRYVPDFGNLTVDVHRRLDGCEAPPEVVWRALSAGASRIDVGGRRVRALNRPGLALHLALHAAQHGPDDLKAIADLTRGLERWPSGIWHGAARLASQLRATDAFAAGLWLVPGGEELARRLELPPPDARLREMAHRSERPRGTFHLRALAEAGSFTERVGVARRSLFPQRAWIVREHPWAATNRLRLAAAYCLHVLRAPVWAVRAWRFRRRSRLSG
jgi:Uncharacterised nucleotidyltransferase